jgi:hypothetical protein
MTDAPNTPQPFDPTTLSDDDLSAEYTRVQTRGAELAAQSEFADGEAAELSELAARIDAIEAERTARETRATELASHRARFANAPAPVVEPAPEPAQAPATPPVVEPTAVQRSNEPVAVPSVSELAVRPAAPVMPANTSSSNGTRIRALVSSDAAGFNGLRVGEEFSGLTDISRALIRNAEQYGRSGGGRGTRQAIAQFQRDRSSEFVVERDQDALSVIRHARSESRLHGGSLSAQWQHYIDQGNSLVAAAGWCAPSENRYDVCRQWGTNVGMLDLPTVTARRGGVNYTDEPSFAAIYANAVAAGGGSNFLTEAQVIADTAKTCSEVPCPTFEDRRLDVLALCIRVSFLQAVGYPELVDTWVDGLLEANAQEMNRIIIADMVARAGGATAITPGVDPDNVLTDSFTSALLAYTELAAEDIRYREGMSFQDTVEIVLPHWVIPQIRADLSRRTRDSRDMLCVTDSQIASLFTCRNLRPQFVRGYQDGLITGGALNPAFPGGIAADPFLEQLPNTVNFLAYPAGSVVLARQDVVTLTNVYDSSSLAVNEFTRLFAEEGFAPLYPCPGIREYTVTGCPGGVVGAAQIECTDAA